MQKALIIQTAFLGDVILATPIIEKLKKAYPGITIDFLLKKGNQPLLENHPHLRKVYLFDKKDKWNSFWRLTGQIRKEKYSLVINLHRYFSSGMFSVLSGANHIIGFDKNPLSFFYHRKYAHRFEPDSMLHEIERNQTLLSELIDEEILMPRLYPTEDDYQAARWNKPYVCICPASVWYTKQWPVPNWINLIDKIPEHYDVILSGGPADRELCDEIVAGVNRKGVYNKSGDYTMLESIALIAKATMNYVNDSAPLHMASAMNAPVAAVFCSTIPGFGFYPLSDQSKVFETPKKLSCRPCGIHGRKSCPEGHFSCVKMDHEPMIDWLFRADAKK